VIGIGVVGFCFHGEVLFQDPELLVIVLDEGEVLGNHLAHHGVGEVLHDSLAFTLFTDATSQRGQIVLADGILNVGNQIRSPYHLSLFYVIS